MQIDVAQTEQGPNSLEETGVRLLSLEENLGKLGEVHNVLADTLEKLLKGHYDLVHDFNVIFTTLYGDDNFRPLCPECWVEMSTNEEGTRKCPDCGYVWGI